MLENAQDATVLCEEPLPALPAREHTVRQQEADGSQIEGASLSDLRTCGGRCGKAAAVVLQKAIARQSRIRLVWACSEA